MKESVGGNFYQCLVKKHALTNSSVNHPNCENIQQQQIFDTIQGPQLHGKCREDDGLLT